MALTALEVRPSKVEALRRPISRRPLVALQDRSSGPLYFPPETKLTGVCKVLK